MGAPRERQRASGDAAATPPPPDADAAAPHAPPPPPPPPPPRTRRLSWRAPALRVRVRRCVPLTRSTLRRRWAAAVALAAALVSALLRGSGAALPPALRRALRLGPRLVSHAQLAAHDANNTRAIWLSLCGQARTRAERRARLTPSPHLPPRAARAGV